ncbi:biotin carboxyl carrier protein /biotin carboxylase [Dongia mobilis]|uniref:propionyl-CoA carboxylase n=1 Tax=Dongia mobilis TaxID=578943 RepID=A0A4R6WQF3_9PROT|nr:acetyl/propionyl/methylcrotonyl-CoA carboxylase subunit alpha [Dongia mobilis]TDQ83812.1 biotin carboxyl carrier protein /biotin carboxylase [Dongia mobilis]
MFKKILIANRGEIACRVIKTARAMGIKTVAVYSEADADALHVRMADEAVAIGPAAARESYLVIEKIVDACKQTGAEAVHPGYGFLSENMKFAEVLKAAGITFIGPDVHAIFAMGDKIESKKLAKEAGVNMVPGFLDVIKDADHAVKIAREIGYPVMIKASAGGGGKGMRVAYNDAEARDGFRSATAEAKSSFADDRVFIEKFIEEPRHIEIQVLADGHGNCLYLGERECSIQRRHQKVIEEAPSPFLDEKTRAAMGEQAVALAKAVQYKSAGTVEFIVDGKRNFYFLEMNTRLQVEHPVTELVTGLDLVEQMIRVAAGEKLKLKQSDIRLKGWAIEARVYAEDPLRNFLPSIGRLVRYREPKAGPQVRVDSGVYEGAEISMFYDPMIAKLVTYGADRREATQAMREALDAFHIRGLNHNIPFLAALVAHERFVAGRLTTGFIAEEFPDGFHGVQLAEDDLADLVAVAACVHHQYELRAHGRSPRFHSNGSAVSGEWVVKLGEAKHRVTLAETAAGFAVIDGRKSRELVSDWKLGEVLWRGRIDGRSVTLQVDRIGIGYRLTYAGAQANLLVLTARAAELDAHMLVKQPPDLSKYLLSPMPGLLVSLAVAEAQEVKAGEELCVVEAMKMMNILRAERDGKVAKIHASIGDSLAVDQVIVEFA